LWPRACLLLIRCCRLDDLLRRHLHHALFPLLLCMHVLTTALHHALFPRDGGFVHHHQRHAGCVEGDCVEVVGAVLGVTPK